MRLLPIVFDNPVLNREIRLRMRQRSSVRVILAYVGLVCAIALSLFGLSLMRVETDGSLAGIRQASAAARAVFFGVLAVQATLALVIAPLSAAMTVTRERERSTYEPIRATPMGAMTHVVGLMSPLVLEVALLLLCSAPILVLPVRYGGVASQEALVWALGLLTLSLPVCAAGTAISAFSLNSLQARTRMILALVAIGAVALVTTGLSTAIFDRGVVSVALTTSFQIFGTDLLAPGWAFLIALTLAITAIFMVIAARAIHNDRTRPLGYAQSLIFGGLILLVVAAALWGADDVRGAVSWTRLGALGLMAVSWAQGSWRISYGDDLWRLKKRFPPMRWFDEAPFCMAAMAGLWAWAAWLFWARGTRVELAATARAALICHVVVTTFFSAAMLSVIRVFLRRRRWLWAVSLGVTIAVWIGPSYMRWGGLGAERGVLSWLVNLSPLSTVSVIADPSSAGGITDWFSIPGGSQVIVLAVGALVLVGLLLPVYHDRIALPQKRAGFWDAE